MENQVKRNYNIHVIDSQQCSIFFKRCWFLSRVNEHSRCSQWNIVITQSFCDSQRLRIKKQSVPGTPSFHLTGDFSTVFSFFLLFFCWAIHHPFVLSLNACASNDNVQIRLYCHIDCCVPSISFSLSIKPQGFMGWLKIFSPVAFALGLIVINASTLLPFIAH